MQRSGAVYAPRVLRNLAEICAEMGVGKDTVKQWLDAGAPIVVEKEGARARYSAELASLQAWRLEWSRKRGGADG